MGAEAVIGILGMVIGIAVTVLASRYYFQRSTKKELSAFRLLSSRIFQGIDPAVRKTLRFTYDNREVQELSQFSVLIANTGERAISNFIEPINIELPENSKVLDTSVEHRNPKSLKVRIGTVSEQSSNDRIVIDVPLLNKDDFFVVKALAEGDFTTDDLKLSLLADDLPRAIKLKFLPYGSTTERPSSVEWPTVFAGGVITCIGIVCSFVIWQLFQHDPTLFLIPWSTFEWSWKAIPIHIFVILTGMIFLAGLGLGIGEALSGTFTRRKRFPLPKHIDRGGALLFRHIEHRVVDVRNPADEE